MQARTIRASITLILTLAQLPWAMPASALRPEPDAAGLEQALAPASANGLEENPTARAAGVIRQHHVVPDAAAGAADVAVVEAFVNRLRQPPNPTADQLPSLSVATYHPGVFSREELQQAGHAVEASYPGEEWLPALRNVISAIAEQVGVKSDELSRLGLPVLEQFLTDLYWAQDADGRLLMGPDEESIFYRWAYREIPEWLVPALADPAIDRDALHRALTNPFQLTNDRGNDAMVAAIAKLLVRQPSNKHPGEFVDDPGRLRADPKLLTPWIRLLLASNLVDYSRQAIFEDVKREGDLAQYVVNRIGTPFLEGLGGDRYLRQFLEQMMQPGMKLIQFPDNNAQLAASLKLAEVLLSANPTLTITMVLKADNGVMNDASVEDAERLLARRAARPDVYQWLRNYRGAGRLTILRGAATHGSPLTLLPAEVVAALQGADVVFAEGEANAWTFNGLAKELYLGLRLKWPDGVRRVFGVSPEELSGADQLRLRPPAFVRIDGRLGPYYDNIFGFHGRPARTIAQTLREQAAGLEEPQPPWARGYQATTLFFEPQQLERLRTQAERVVNSGRPFRVVSAGASSGEEPASIAYTLWRQFGLTPSGPITVDAIESDPAMYDEMRGHLDRAIPFVDNPRLAYPPARVKDASRLNDTIQVWGSWIHPHLDRVETIEPSVLQDADAVVLNRVTDTPGVNIDAIATALLALPADAILYTTRMDERLLDLMGPGSGFAEVESAMTYRRMSRAEELADIAGVLYDKDTFLARTLHNGGIATLDHMDARWIPADRQLLCVPETTEESPGPTIVWTTRSVATLLRPLLPSGITLREFEQGADLLEAMRQASSGEGAPHMVVVNAMPDPSSLPARHPPVLVISPETLPEGFEAALRVIAHHRDALLGRLIDLTRGPVEHATVQQRDIVLLYAV